MWQKNLDKLEGQTVRHTYILYTQPYILLVSPPVVAVPRGATIIQPSVVKTESDVMRTVKQPWPSSDTFQQITCHAEAMHKPSHTHGGGLLCYTVNDSIMTTPGDVWIQPWTWNCHHNLPQNQITCCRVQMSLDCTTAATEECSRQLAH